jgi:hypothetical protein
MFPASAFELPQDLKYFQHIIIVKQANGAELAGTTHVCYDDMAWVASSVGVLCKARLANLDTQKVSFEFLSHEITHALVLAPANRS